MFSALSELGRNERDGPFSPEINSLHDETWPVDSELLSLLDDHCIGGCRVVPGAGLAAFIALSVPGTNPSGFRSLQFHRPLEVKVTGSRIVARMSDDATFTITHEVPNGTIEKIGSGTTIDLHQIKAAPEPHPQSSDQPSRIIYRKNIYSSFKAVHFGPRFQNIHQVAFWNDRAEAIIGVATTGDSRFDLIRKLDPCLHMFGPIESFLDPDRAGLQGGAYLPSSLNGFTMHAQVLPDTFICRYRLPLQHERKSHVLSTSFEVLSDAGDVLITCEKYSVAWIPFSVIQKDPDVEPITKHSWSYSWVEEETSLADGLVQEHANFESLVLVGVNTHVSPILPHILSLAPQTFLIEISESDDGAYLSEMLTEFPTTSVSEAYRLTGTTLQRALHGRKTLFVLDATVESPDTNQFLKRCGNVFSLLKILAGPDVPLGGLIVVSRMAFPIADCSQGVPLLCEEKLPHFAFGSAVQGMVSVWRRECGLSPNSVWGLDLPNSKMVDLGQVIKSELQIRMQSLQCHNRIALRAPNANQALARLVPSIGPSTSEKLEKRFSGVAVITGMGSIGQALAPNLIASGCKAVIYLGRTAGTNGKVRGPPVQLLLNLEYVLVQIVSALTRLHAEYPRTPVHYMQCDVSNVFLVIEALQKITELHGSITTIIHTAGVVQDASVTNMTSERFNAVVAPKIMGGWSLHVASVKLALPLQNFVVLSSIR